MDRDRAKRILYGISAAGLVALAIVLIVLVSGGGSNAAAGNPQAIAATMHAAGCTLTTSPSSPSAQHIAKISDPVTYSTYPPTSGHHYYIPAIWGNYTQIVDPRVAVHNEEHGGIDIWVGPDVSAAERQKI